MHRSHRVFLTAFILAYGVNAAAAAQTIRTDPTTGDRVISYTVNGTSYEATVPGNDRIAPEMRLISITESSGTFTYSYRLLNHDQVPALRGRGAWMVDLPCVGVNSQDVVGAPNEWLGELLVGATRSVCRFSVLGDHALEPGDSSPIVSLRSRALPAFVVGQAYGIGGPTSVPSDEDVTPDTVWALVRNLRGPGGSGSGAHIQLVAPFYLPSALPGPISVLQLMESDILLMCGDLGWIDNQGVCRSLNAKLSNSAAALQRDDITAAEGQMDAFTQELRAQRGHHISQSGYAFLQAMVEYLGKNM